MWLDQDCRGVNQVANVLLMVVILAEPLAHALIAIKYAATPGWSLPLLAAVSGVFLVLMALGIKPYADQLCAHPINEGQLLRRHLWWGWIPPGSDYFRFDPDSSRVHYTANALKGQGLRSGQEHS